MTPRLTLSISLLLGPAVALAQQEVDRAANGSPGNQLERVEVRRTLADTDLRRREPVAKQLYGREELDKYGDTQLGDVLKRLPGINVSGGQLRMRGLGGAYTQILVNGEPAPAGFSLDNLNPQQVERLEVSKAPTADQSAQAIAGTLNIVLRDAPRVTQKDVRLGVAFANEKPALNAGFTYGDRAVGHLGFVLPVSVYQWDYHTPTADDRLRNDGAQRLLSSGEDRTHGEGINVSPRLNWKLGDDETLTLQGLFIRHRFHNDVGNTTQVLLGGPPPSVLDSTRNRGTSSVERITLQYNNRFSEDRRIELRAGTGSGGADFDLGFQGRDAAGKPTVVRDTTGRNRNHNTTLAGKYSQYAGEAHTLTVGSELERRVRDESRRTVENGQELLPGIEGQPFDATITRSAVYAQDEWEISTQWSAYLGIRHERIKTVSSGLGHDFDNTSRVTTPLLHANFKPDPKARDLIRFSLTRSYKTPDVQQLIARPTINTDYPTHGINTPTAPDRIGNPALKPELATGLDIAWENYLPAGGLVSVGVFQRRISHLMRNDLVLENAVSWATAPRWVARPINLIRATTQGLEIEIKGRAAELLPSLFEPAAALNLRASLNLYRSSVADILGPDNRLEGQQPWQFNVGADYRMKSLPISMGFSAQVAPRFDVRQGAEQAQTTLAARSVDAFAVVQFGRQDSLRASFNEFFQSKGGTRAAIVGSGDFSLSERSPVPWVALTWEHKL